jgi:hypothetical protein
VASPRNANTGLAARAAQVPPRAQTQKRRQAVCVQFLTSSFVLFGPHLRSITRAAGKRNPLGFQRPPGSPVVSRLERHGSSLPHSQRVVATATTAPTN